jgi:hypothetical protein
MSGTNAGGPLFGGQKNASDLIPPSFYVVWVWSDCLDKDPPCWILKIERDTKNIQQTMSVNHSYYSLDWEKISQIEAQGSIEFLLEEMEESEMPDWISEVPFGRQVDGYYFSSWVWLMDFKEWFDKVRPIMESPTVKDFAALMQDVGLLMDDDFSFVPINAGVDFEDEWLLGAIPPGEIQKLNERASGIDTGILLEEFQNALERHPSDQIESGKFIRDWFFALKEGLVAVESRSFGIILGAS